MLNILIVDDSPSVRFHLRTLLAPHGHCDEAGDGSEAVTQCEASLQRGAHYDLIIMDLMMPEMDGFTAIQNIQALQERFNVPEEKRANIAILSCKDDPPSMLRAHYGVGVEHYLTKPFTKKTLFEILENMGLATETQPPDAT